MKYKIIGVRWYNNEKGKGTIYHYAKELKGDAVGYEGKMEFLLGENKKDIHPGDLVEFLFDRGSNGRINLVEVKKVEE